MRNLYSAPLKTGPRIRPEIVDLATLKKCAIGLNALTKPRCNPECPFAPALSQDWQHTHNIFETRPRFGYGLMPYQDGRLENPIFKRANATLKSDLNLLLVY